MTEKTIFITGCSSGIGYACAHGLARRKGWRVVASCRKAEDVERLRGEGLDCVQLDYTDPASIEAGFAAALALTGGKLHVLFNNGAYAAPGMVEDIPTAMLREIFETNFFGWHTLTRLALPVMRAQEPIPAFGRGRIVQNSSVLGFVTLKARGAYNSTKFALEGLTDTLRVEMHGTGITPILIEPGPVTSKIRENSRVHYEAHIKPQKPQTAWSAFYDKALEPRLYSAANKDRFELPEEAVLKKLIHAIESPKPRARYYVTTPTYVMGALKRLLPTRMMDTVLRRA